MASDLIALAERWPTAETTRQLEGESDKAWADRTFCPSFPGIHLCGADHEENRFFTIIDLPMANDAEALSLWNQLKLLFEVDKDAADFLVDLNTKHGHEDDFWSNRQTLPRIAASFRARSQGNQHD